MMCGVDYPTRNERVTLATAWKRIWKKKNLRESEQETEKETEKESEI